MNLIDAVVLEILEIEKHKNLIIYTVKCEDMGGICISKVCRNEDEKPLMTGEIFTH